jgi:malate dehydrogenase (oxaloacetate-decarboxylating)(NADP+)
VDEGRVDPILLGSKASIMKKIEELHLTQLHDVSIMTPHESEHYNSFTTKFFESRQRKGVSYSYAKDVMKTANYFGSMMVTEGVADGMVTGATQNYPECMRPIMKVIGSKGKAPSRVSGVMILIFKQKVMFLTDCTAQVNPTSEDLADNAINTAELYRRVMKKEPRVAFLSYSNFGSNRSDSPSLVSKAVKIAKQRDPNLIADGEMQADVATNSEIMKTLFSFCELDRSADVLVFPDLNSANISYKLLVQLGEAVPVGPILLPLDHAINIVQRTASVEEIVNMAHLTALISEEIKTKNLQ